MIIQVTVTYLIEINDDEPDVELDLEPDEFLESIDLKPSELMRECLDYTVTEIKTP